MASTMRVGLLLWAAVLPAACDRAEPTAPTPVTSTPAVSSPPGAPAVSYVLRGAVVDDDEQPVAGATVLFLGPQIPVTVLTDAGGQFEATLELRQQGSSVTVSRSDYEPSQSYVAADRREVVRLYPIKRITAGASVQLTLVNGAYCGFEYEYNCRRIRVLSLASGTLTVDITPADFKLVEAGPLQYPDRSTSHLVLPARAGQEMAIDVLAPWLPSRAAFVVDTVLEPSR